ncbi:MAG: HlyD family efflux transporter periplasmic adaptor subunit, partial [Microbacterium sp.]|nr:HlyD family efflux transporter periplasmic adaptor subunit [Microbacterium sp.]
MADEMGDAGGTAVEHLVAPADGAGSTRPRRRWYRRPLLWVAIGVVVLAVGVGAFFVVRASARVQASPITYRVTSTTLQQTVSTTGTIEPAHQSQLSFVSPGTVSSVSVKVGDKVSAGEKLAAIDPASLQSDVTLAEAQVAEAQAQVSASAGGSATEEASAAAQLASAQAKLQSAQQALTAATLVSPIAGVVASVGVAVGDQVGGSSSTGTSASRTATGSPGTGQTTTTATAAISVISTDSWIVNAAVGSSDLPSIKPGLQVQITPSGAQKPIFGTVSSAGIVASSSTGGAASFPVVIAVTGTPTGLYAGTSASVSIIVKQIADALVVPTQAVHTTAGR